MTRITQFAALLQLLPQLRPRLLPQLLRRLLKDTKGGLAAEMALTLPVLLALLIGVVETAYYYFLNAALENAVLHASRFGVTGNEDAGTTREDQLRSIIETQTFGRIPPEGMIIETLVYESFSDIGKPEPFTDLNGNEIYDEGEDYSDVNGNGQWDEDLGSAGLGSSGDVVLYRVTYEAPSLTGLYSWATSLVPLSATVAVRNEPF